MCRFWEVLGSVELSFTVCCVDKVFMCRLGLLCAANSCSIKAATACSEECPGWSPYKIR